MGLDAVEIVLEVEESFDITIPDEEASQMLTVGDLYACVLEKIRGLPREPGRCLSASTFYSLRRQLVPMIEDARSIRPSTSICRSVSWPQRRKLWQRVANVSSLRLPRLVRPLWVTVAACAAVAIVAVTCFSWFQHYSIGGAFQLITTLLAAALAAVLLAALTSPLAVLPRASFPTYGGLVRQLLVLNYSKLAERHAVWSPTDVWVALQTIIVEQLGVSKEAVTPTASFVNDLGLR